MAEKTIKVGAVRDIDEGDMKAVEVDDKKILLTRIDGEIFALGHACTHYGAPLETGVLSDGCITCPWHHARFNAKTGEMLDPPAMDSLPVFKVTIEDNNILVTLPEEIPHGRKPDMVRANTEKDSRTFVIVGAGAAGSMAAQTLREEGFEGKIVMLSYENRVPYDRPNLSKDYLQGTAEEEWMPLRPKEFYDEHDIELKLGVRVNQVHLPEKKIVFEDGSTMTYDNILLASGGVPKHLSVPGKDLKNVFTLRSFDDSDAIIKAAKSGSKAVVVGASFIGMETAFSLSERDVDVTVVAPERVPFEHVFGGEIGQLFQKLHEEKGTTFKLGRTVKRFDGKGKVEKVTLDDGTELDADLVIVGIGVKPNTSFIKGVDRDEQGGIRVNNEFRVNESTFAVGDIATFPNWISGTDTRIEHWRTAQQQGRYAARNMVGAGAVYDAVPFFWTTQAGVHFRYVGHAADWDIMHIDGSLDKKDFMAYFFKGNDVHAVCSMGRDRVTAAVHELMRRNRMPGKEVIQADGFDIEQYLQEQPSDRAGT